MVWTSNIIGKEMLEISGGLIKMKNYYKCKQHKCHLRSVSREGAEHRGAKTLEESLGSLVLQENTENVSSSLVSTGGCRLEARLEDIWWDSNGPHSHSGHT